MRNHNVDYDNDEFTSPGISGASEMQSVYNRQLIPEQELESPSIKLKKYYIDNFYEKFEKITGLKANARHYDSIELRDNMLSYDGIKLTTDDLKIRSIKTLASKLGIKRITALVFSEITSKAIKSIPTVDEIEKATPTIEMVDRTIKTVTEIETSFTDIADKENQTKDEFSLRELRGFDKAMQTISGTLKDAVAKKINTEPHIDMEYDKLKELKKRLRDVLEANNDEIKILKDRFSS